MIPAEEKIERMTTVARMYYEHDMNQSQIAKALGISRPLVSVLLSEAKACGIVTITINDINMNEEKLADALKRKFLLKHVILVPDETVTGETNLSVARTAYNHCFDKKNANKSVGIGWGSMMGHMADLAVNLDDEKRNNGSIFPLTGGISSVIRGYHTNEIVRIFALKTGKTADFLYISALFDTNVELELVKQTEPYILIQDKWDKMEQAIVSISNFPSYPDMGVKTIYGDRLTKEHAVGRILAHYYDKNGNIIHPDEDSVLQASLEQMRRAQVTAVCSTQVKAVAIAGALRVGIIDTLILPNSVAKQLLEFRE